MLHDSASYGSPPASMDSPAPLYINLCPAAVKTENTEYPEYCQIMKVKDTTGQVKELVFPKGLDLNRPKRPRTTFSCQQLEVLERRFDSSPYLVGKDRVKLAVELGLSETQIKVWYQNRRTKQKRERNEGCSTGTKSNKSLSPEPAELSPTSDFGAPRIYSGPPMLASLKAEDMHPQFSPQFWMPYPSVGATLGKWN